MKNPTKFLLRVDMQGILTGDARAIAYAKKLRAEVFESNEEMSAYFPSKPGSDFEKFILSL